MPRWILLAVACGAASGLTYYGGANATVITVLLSVFTSLPLFLAGLGIGLAGVVLASVTGLILVGILAPPLHTLVYAAVDALPAIVLCRQALLSRAKPDGSVEWYPGGLLLTWLLGLMALLYLLVLAYFELFLGGLGAAVHGAAKQFFDDLGDAVRPDVAKSTLELAPYVFPGMVASVYVVMILANAAIAQHLLRRSGYNLRPSIALGALALPRQLLYVLTACLLVGMLSDTLAPVACTLAIVVAVAYFLLGLAVVHAFLGARANPGMALFSFYVMLILMLMLFGAMSLVMVGLGIVEQVVGLRRRFAAGTGKENE